jgi:hypothetical protein
MKDLIVLEKIAGWDKLKALVARQRVFADYKACNNVALDEFLPCGGPSLLWNMTDVGWIVGNHCAVLVP